MRHAGRVTPAGDGDTRVLEGTDVEEDLAPLWCVICHDDPVTTMAFVVEVFVGVFRLPRPRAYELMLEVHHSGAALVGRWPEDSARRKANRARSKARIEGYPLTFTVEEDE